MVLVLMVMTNNEIQTLSSLPWWQFAFLRQASGVDDEWIGLSVTVVVLLIVYRL